MIARQNLGERPRVTAELGAVHKINATTEVFDFFGKATTIAKDILIANHDPASRRELDFDFGPLIEVEGVESSPIITEESEGRDTSWYDQDNYYNIFGHDEVWVSILDGSTSKKRAQAARKILQAKDIGHIKQEASDAIAKVAFESPLELVFNAVMLFGRKRSNVDSSGVQTRLALVPDSEKNLETRKRLFWEYDKLTEFLQERHAGAFFSHSYAPFAEFMTFSSGATDDDILQIVGRINEYLSAAPVKVSLKGLEFPDPKTRTKHKR